MDSIVSVSHRKPKKSVFRFGFGSNRHETENETENTKKPIYITETEIEKTETEKRTFFENKFLKLGKKHYLCFFIQ
jgi:hypothetical protein